MLWVKQSTARTITFGPVMDTAGAPYTDSLSYTDFKISKNGSSGTLNSSATATHLDNGHFALALTTDDLNTLGAAEVRLNKTDYMAGVKELLVLSANVYDSVIAASDKLQVDAVEVGGSTSAAAIRTALGLASANLDTQLGDIPTNAEFEARTIPTANYVQNSVWTSQKAAYLDAAISSRSTLVAGSAMTLTEAAQLALVASIELELSNDATGQALMQAIADKLAAEFNLEDLTVTAIATASRDAVLNRVLSGNHDGDGTVGRLLQNADVAVSTRSTFAGGPVASVTDRTGFSLTSAYDAAKSAASQTSVNALGSPMQEGTAVVLSANQPNYTPATAAALAAVAADIDALGSPMQAGTTVVLAISQPNYAPATAAALSEVATAIANLPGGGGSTDASTFTGAFPASVLIHAPRTEMVLSANSLARGPEASLADEDICTSVFKGGTPRLTARVYLHGSLITQAAASTVVYSVFELGSHPDDRTPVVGHTNVSLSAADVIFDSLRTDAQASKYNFCHQVPVSVHPAFIVAGRTYQVEYIITPVEGEPVIVRFQVSCI